MLGEHRAGEHSHPLPQLSGPAHGGVVAGSESAQEVATCSPASCSSQTVSGLQGPSIASLPPRTQTAGLTHFLFGFRFPLLARAQL